MRVKRSELGFVTRNIWESKFNAAALLGFVVYLVFYGVLNVMFDMFVGFVMFFKE